MASGYILLSNKRPIGPCNKSKQTSLTRESAPARARSDLYEKLLWGSPARRGNRAGPVGTEAPGEPGHRGGGLRAGGVSGSRVATRSGGLNAAPAPRPQGGVEGSTPPGLCKSGPARLGRAGPFSFVATIGASDGAQFTNRAPRKNPEDSGPAVICVRADAPVLYAPARQGQWALPVKGLCPPAGFTSRRAWTGPRDAPGTATYRFVRL